jgi:hypothetical protein
MSFWPVDVQNHLPVRAQPKACCVAAYQVGHLDAARLIAQNFCLLAAEDYRYKLDNWCVDSTDGKEVGKGMFLLRRRLNLKCGNYYLSGNQN